MTASAMPPSRTAAAAAAAAAQDFGAFADIFEIIFGEFMGGGGGGRAATRCAAPTCATIWRSALEDAFHGKRGRAHGRCLRACEPCDGTGAKAGTGAPRPARMCGGHGKVRAQQGFFVVERTCPTCHGVGEVIADPCRACRGEGRVDEAQDARGRHSRRASTKAPASASPAKARPARAARPPGDLYIFVHVTRHAIFQREGTTLFARCPISFTTAALGGDDRGARARRQTHEISIPAGIQSGKQLRQRGAGMPVLQGRGHGDLVIQIEVETPTKLSAKQREILEQFRETETGEECPDSKGFFQKLKTAIGG